MSFADSEKRIPELWKCKMTFPQGFLEYSEGHYYLVCVRAHGTAASAHEQPGGSAAYSVEV